MILFFNRSQIIDAGLNDLVYTYPAKLNDSNFKGAVQVFHNFLHFQAKDTNGTFLNRILNERVFADMYVWYFTQDKRSFINIIDRKLQQLFVGGIIDFYDAEYKEQINPIRYKHFQATKGPKILTMTHLRAGFAVWLVSVFFAIFAFFCEWMPTLTVFLVYKYNFKTFYEQKQLKMNETRAYVEALGKFDKKLLETANALEE